MNERRTALLIANGAYESDDWGDLKSPSSDAVVLAELLSDTRIGNYDAQILVDADQRTIKIALERLLLKAEDDQDVLIHLSGHGERDGDGKLCYIPSDGERDYLHSTAVEAAWLRSLLDASRSTHQLLLIDCCFAGAFTQTRFAKSSDATARNLGGQGRAVFMASTAYQQSFESPESKDGPAGSDFTTALIHGIRTGDADLDADGLITAEELYRYVHTRLAQGVPPQTPTWTADQVVGGLVVARTPMAVSLAHELPAGHKAAASSPLTNVRLAAVEELKVLGKSVLPERAAAVRKVLSELTDDPSPRVRRAASDALTDLRPRRRRPTKPKPKVQERIAQPEDPDTLWCVVRSGTLRRVVKNVLVAASEDLARPILNSVYLSARDGKLSAVATDAYRIAIFEVDCHGPGGAVTVQSHEFSGVAGFRGDTDVRVVFDPSGADFVSPTHGIFAPAIEGDFPDYQRILGGLTNRISVTLNRRDLISAIEELAGNLNAPYPLVVAVDGDRTEIYARRGEARDDPSDRKSLRGDTVGQSTTFALNPRYLLDGLLLLEGDLVRLTIDDDLKPVLVDDPGDLTFRYVVMPVRLS